MDGHELRCTCAECVEARGLIRTEALIDMVFTPPANEAETWANRSWDSPSRRFPVGGTWRDDDAQGDRQ